MFPGLKITASPGNLYGKAFVNFTTEQDAAVFMTGVNARQVMVDGKVIVAERIAERIAHAVGPLAPVVHHLGRSQDRRHDGPRPCRYGADCRNKRDGSCSFQHPPF